MAEYHVGCGVFGIYAGTLNRKGDLWQNKSDVTEEALGAVRDYMVNDLLGGFNCEKTNKNGYVWELKDGRTVKLEISINESEE